MMEPEAASHEGVASRILGANPNGVERIGVVVVHGVMPHPRYEIQDECAGELANALNCDPVWGRGPKWVYSVCDLPEPGMEKTLVPRPTTSRVRRDGDDPVHPAQTYFDVIEAYWSPLDKGKATFARVTGWLLQSIFVPLNTTATYVSHSGKTLFDVGLVTGGIFAVVALVAAALLCAVLSLAALSGKPLADAAGALINGKILGFLPFNSLVLVGIGIVGSYLLAQALKGAIGLWGQWSAHNVVPAQTHTRIVFIAVVALVGIVLLSAVRFLSAWGAAVAATGFLFEGGRTIAKSFLVNFFGDVQIYTTRDENVDYNAMRASILECVSTTIQHVASDAANAGGGYDRVFVLAHSLGSTIALDALMQYWRAIEQVPAAERPAALTAFRRIRGLVTFGSPLEKTKYLFDVGDPSPSLALEQWRADAYGPLFTRNISELNKPNAGAEAIFWANYWYFKDPVSNELWSYRSFVPPGKNPAIGHHLRHAMAAAHGNSPVVGRLVCWNERGSKGFVFPAVIPHGEYLKDPWFWNSNSAAKRRVTRRDRPGGNSDGEASDLHRGHLGVLDIIARTEESVDRTAFVKSDARVDERTGATYERLAAGEAAKLHDFRPADTRNMDR